MDLSQIPKFDAEHTHQNIHETAMRMPAAKRVCMTFIPMGLQSSRVADPAGDATVLRRPAA